MAGTDRPMNSFPVVTGAEYVYVEDVNGNQVKISKAYLAIILRPYLSIVYNSGIIDCDTLKVEKTHAGYRWVNSPTSNIAILEVLPYSNDWVVQRFINISTNEFWMRTFISGATWTAWKKISFTS